MPDAAYFYIKEILCMVDFTDVKLVHACMGKTKPYTKRPIIKGTQDWSQLTTMQTLQCMTIHKETTMVIMEKSNSC